MFFDSDIISAKIESVLNLKWDKRNDKSDVRPYHALSYRVKGSVEFIHNGYSTFVKTGEIVFVPAFLEYRLRSEAEELFVVHFTSKDPLPNEIKVFSPETTRIFKEIFFHMHSSWKKRQFGFEYECQSVLYKIFMNIERESAEKKFFNSSDRIIEALEYIHENFRSQDLSVAHLAHMCGMSDTYFRNLFVKHFSVTPLKYINNLKLDFALELLESGYFTIGVVAQKTGFDNVYYFSSFIKKQTGHSPSVFLKKHMHQSY